MKLSLSELAAIGGAIIIIMAAGAHYSPSVRGSLAAEPPLEVILEDLGFTNRTKSTAETFPSGLYEITLYAEFASYHASNELGYYPVNTSDIEVLFLGEEGNNGYVSPPMTKTFFSNTTFGLSMFVGAENHTYFTENWRNPDGQNHSTVYLNLNEPNMHLIAFENWYGLGDRDYNDMVLSLQLVKHYLTVETDPPGTTTIPGEGWYTHATEATLVAPTNIPVSPGAQYNFSHWDVDNVSKGAGINLIKVYMDANHTATAHYKLQYHLTVTSPYDTTGGEGWYVSGGTAYATLNTSLVDHGNGTRRVFTHWGGDASGTDYAQSDPILMDANKTAVAVWKTQYYLTVSTDPIGIADITGEGWYNRSTIVPLVAPLVPDYRFLNWTIDGAQQGPGLEAILVHMDAPHIAVAHYKFHVVGGVTQFVELSLLSLRTILNVILITSVLLMAIWRKRRTPSGLKTQTKA